MKPNKVGVSIPLVGGPLAGGAIWGAATSGIGNLSPQACAIAAGFFVVWSILGMIGAACGWD